MRFNPPLQLTSSIDHVRVCSGRDPVEKPEPTIRVYKRRNEAGEIVGWSAEINIPGINRLLRRHLPNEGRRH
jgi:hypothetical protein